MTRQETIDKASEYFNQGYACSQSVLLAFAPRYNLDEKTAKLISSTFGGGMGRLRQKCGAVTGGFMVLGLEFGNQIPTDMETKLNSYKKVRELNAFVVDIHGSAECGEILTKFATQADVEQRKHHKIICNKIVIDVAGFVYDMIKINDNEK